MMRGNVAVDRTRLIVWCRDGGRQVEPDPAEMAAPYGAEATVIDWRWRFVCSKCDRREVHTAVTGTKWRRGA
jgi:hypothetical protein